MLVYIVNSKRRVNHVLERASGHAPKLMRGFGGHEKIVSGPNVLGALTSRAIGTQVLIEFFIYPPLNFVADWKCEGWWL
jgi:hypothetical protein